MWKTQLAALLLSTARKQKGLARLSVAAFITALSTGAMAQHGEFVNGVLQPLEDGFPNRPITLVVNDEPGSAEGIMARHLQAALAAISPVPILVSDEPHATGGTFDKLLELRGRDGGTDGYYPVAVNVYGSSTDPLTQNLEADLGMTLEDMNIVAVTETATMVVMTRKDAPWGPTWAGLVAYALEHPGEVRYISSTVGGGNDIAFEYIAQLAGIRDNLRKIPDVNVQAVVNTIAAGEGDVGIGSSGVARGPWEEGRLNVVMSTLDYVPEPYNQNPDVVTAEQAGLGQIDLGNYRGWAVPKDTPASHVEWLYKLLAAATADETYRTERDRVIPGNRVLAMPPAEANQLARDLMTKFEPIVRAIGLHWEQQQ